MQSKETNTNKDTKLNTSEHLNKKDGQVLSTNENEDSTSSDMTAIFTNQYVNDKVRTLISICIVLLISNILLLGFIAIQYISKPQEAHFALKPNGSLYKLRTLSAPNLSTNTLLAWATNAATDTYTYDFSNIERKIGDLKKYYTKKGYTSLLEAIKKSGNLKSIKQNKLTVSSTPRNVPTIIAESVNEKGEYFWLVEMPLLVSYRSSSDEKLKNLTISMLIVRVPTNESASGVGIAQIKIKGS